MAISQAVIPAAIVEYKKGLERKKNQQQINPLDKTFVVKNANMGKELCWFVYCARDGRILSVLNGLINR